MKKIRFEIKLSGGPYPHQCWWRIVGSNGRIFVSSELMSKRNAKRSIAKVISSIKKGIYDIVIKEVR